MSEDELSLGALLEQLEPQFDEARDLGLRERLERELRERLSAPQRERLPEQARPPRRIARAGLVDEPAHAREVELTGVDADQVAGRPRDDRLGPERLAKLDDEVLQRVRRRARRLARPQCVDQPVGRDHAAGVEEQEGEQRPLLRRAERDSLAVGDRLQRAEDPELDHCARCNRPGGRRTAAVTGPLATGLRPLRRCPHGHHAKHSQPRRRRSARASPRRWNRARRHHARLAAAAARRGGSRRRRLLRHLHEAAEHGDAGCLHTAELRTRHDRDAAPPRQRHRPAGQDLPRRRRPRRTARRSAGHAVDHSPQQRLPRRREARRLAERLLLRRRRHPRAWHLVRAVRPPAGATSACITSSSSCRRTRGRRTTSRTATRGTRTRTSTPST